MRISARRKLMVVAVAGGLAAAGLFGAHGAGAAAPPVGAPPVVKARVTKPKGVVRGSFVFRSKTKPAQRTIVVVRSDGREILRKARAPQSGSWADKTPLAGTSRYRARLFIDGVAQPWGEWVSVTNGVVTTTTPPTTSTPPTTANPGTWPYECPAGWEDQLLDLVRAERKKRKLNPEIVFNAKLKRAADEIIAYNAQKGTLTHEHDSAAYANAGYRAYAGTNLAVGSFTPKQVFDAWMASKTPKGSSHFDHIVRPGHVNAAAECVAVTTASKGPFYWAFTAGFRE